MRKRALSLVVITMVSILLMGCTQGAGAQGTNVKGNAIYASMLIFGDTYYYLSSEVISQENLVEQIGQVEKQVAPSPKNNGEANECPRGTKIYQIKGVDRKESVAVAFRNEFRKASILALEKSDGVTKIYTDKRFNFSVEYPVKWTAKLETFIEPNAEHNGSPDGGIRIYVDGKQDESIYIYGQFGQIRTAIDGFHREEFTTNSGLKGLLYSDEINGKREIDLILGEGFHGAHLSIGSELFNQNKGQIMDVLKSMKIGVN